MFLTSLLQATSHMGESDQPLFKMLSSDYGERTGGQTWTVPATKVVKSILVSTPERPAPKASDWVINAAAFP